MSVFQRKRDTRKIRKVIRIYTEGTKTEPNYFGSIKDELRISEIDIQIQGVRGFNNHTLPLVGSVIERKKEEEKNNDFETEWWVVFDKDDFPDFNSAIDLAQKHGINVVYSNECFELWFILHFEFLQTSLGRNNFEPKLSKLLGRKYEKKSSDIYDLIKDKESNAIRYAKKLEKMHDDEKVSSPEQRVPSTLVYKLVERLRSLKTERE
ncbi:MAG: RloB family protein [Candidatus Parcubacteria bacterium]|nr:RloB family protein [Candidatus Parcubacteria bacterium]